MKYLCLFGCLLLPGPVLAGGSAAVFLRQSEKAQGISPATQLELVRGALAAQRIPICRPPGAPDVLPSSSQLAALLEHGGCARLFIVLAEPVTQSWQVTLEELNPNSNHVIRRRQGVFSSIEQVKDHIPRLVRDLLRAQSAQAPKRRAAPARQGARSLSRDVADDEAGASAQLEAPAMIQPDHSLEQGELEPERPPRTVKELLLEKGARAPQPLERGLGLGLTFSRSLEGSGHDGLGLSGHLSLERGPVRTEASLRMMRHVYGSGDSAALSLGAAYLFAQGNTAPYLAASVGYGRHWPDGSFALLGDLGAGLEWRRQQPLRFRFDLRVARSMKPEGPNHGPVVQGLFGLILRGN